MQGHDVRRRLSINSRDDKAGVGAGASASAIVKINIAMPLDMLRKASSRLGPDHLHKGH